MQRRGTGLWDHGGRSSSRGFPSCSSREYDFLGVVDKIISLVEVFPSGTNQSHAILVAFRIIQSYDTQGKRNGSKKRKMGQDWLKRLHRRLEQDKPSLGFRS